MKERSLLVVPAVGRGRGGGHLARSLALVRSLRGQGNEAWLYLEEGPVFEPELALSTGAELSARSWDWIILDRFRSSAADFARWQALAPVIGIDEGGHFRSRFDFLVDSLPSLPGTHPPNLTFCFNPRPVRRREPSFAFSPASPKVLISFGAEDPAGLTVPAALALAKAAPELEVTALFGCLNNNASGMETLAEAGIEVLDALPDLREHLADYDLVITHFGLTAFESLAAGIPVILVSPTRYHERLARATGFPSAGSGPAAAARLPGLFLRNGRPDPAALETAARQGRNIALKYGLLDVPDPEQDLAHWEPLVFMGCPLCGGGNRTGDPVLARFPERTYRRCRCCGTVYQNRRNQPPVEYGKDYFFDAYRKQYGKTYLEDFPSLKAAARIRLGLIQRILRVSGKGEGLLDIGCAYGPFLAAAAEAGFAPEGIEPAEDAADWVRRELGIPVHRGFFPDPSFAPPPEHFAVVTLWYVIEHFRNPGAILAGIHRILKPGGVLAFSTPALAGISGRVSKKKFLEKSPQDHFTVWDSRQTGRILRRFGFRLKKIRITGHHPERFPLIGKLLVERRGLLYGICLALSRIFRLGDTFEGYAVKQGGRYDAGS